jgi:beta-lactam-binding protein with PASTA domain
MTRRRGGRDREAEPPDAPGPDATAPDEQAALDDELAAGDDAEFGDAIEFDDELAPDDEIGRDDEIAIDEDIAPDDETGPEVPAGEVLVESDTAFTELAYPATTRRHRIAGAAALLLLAMTAFATGLVVFNNMVMPRLIHSVAEVKVPDLANLTVLQAEKQLAALGLQLSRAGERFDPSVPTGFILAQDPPADTPVRGKKRVMVMVSLGEEFSSVPELFGESLRGARLLVDRAGLKLGGVSRAPSDEVGEGLVVASDPRAESVLPRDTPIGILVSSGAGPEYFVMPDLLGREIGGVRRQLEAEGFRVFTPPAAASIGTVAYQNPAPGSRVTREDNILLQATGRMIR